MGRVFRDGSWKFLPSVALAFTAAVWAGTSWSDALAPRAHPAVGEPPAASAFRSGPQLISDGRGAFRYETFGNEAFWGDELQLHRALEGEALGGEGPGVTLATALRLGLKVDASALPGAFNAALKAGTLDLDSPRTLRSLLEVDAVVGLTGFFSVEGSLTSVGVQCALCHSTVDDSVRPGVGRRLDGWANRDLDVGALLALAPSVGSLAAARGVDEPTLRKALRAWGPGRVDVPLLLERAASKRAVVTLIPPVFGRGSVINQSRHGPGVLFDPRTRGSVAQSTEGPEADLVTPRLTALLVYQLVLRPPKPMLSVANLGVAARGRQLFEGRARCATCHVPPLFTERDVAFHVNSEPGLHGGERFVRTAPLLGLSTHLKGGLYRDGRFKNLAAVVAHYDQALRLKLTARERNELVVYLTSL